MERAIALLSRPASDVILLTAGMAAAVEVCRRWTKGWSDGYRPELHYMRGPGPKWRVKHRAGEAFRQPPFDSFRTQRQVGLQYRA
jgi:hypothetical protein